MMIPKIIHYCWFGNKEKPAIVQHYIQTWRKYLPDYKIVEWNEHSVDIEVNDYVQQAYKVKKYAFVSDYARLFALYQEGGIYFDTDMELLKSFDCFLPLNLFFGFETVDTVASCVIGSDKQNKHIKALLDEYNARNFIKEDGSYDTTTNVIHLTSYLQKQGLLQNGAEQTFNNITVFPADFFCPKDFITEKINITKNTHAIHHFDGSWTDKRALRWYRFKQKISRKMNPALYQTIKNMIKKEK